MDETPSRSLQPAVHTTTPDAKVQPQFCHNLFVGFWVSDLTSVCFSFICKIWQLSCRVKVKIAQSCPTLCDSIDWSMEFSRPEYWSGQPFPSPKDLPNPGIEPRFPTLQADSLSAEPPRKPKNNGVGRLSLLQQIFPAQESKRGLLHFRWILYQLS